MTLKLIHSSILDPIAIPTSVNTLVKGFTTSTIDSGTQYGSLTYGNGDSNSLNLNATFVLTSNYLSSRPFFVTPTGGRLVAVNYDQIACVTNEVSDLKLVRFVHVTDNTSDEPCAKHMINLHCEDLPVGSNLTCFAIAGDGLGPLANFVLCGNDRELYIARGKQDGCENVVLRTALESY